MRLDQVRRGTADQPEVKKSSRFLPATDYSLGYYRGAFREGMKAPARS